MRIFGPNCQGIINTDPDIKAYCDFTFTFPESGYISIVAQSGGVGAVLMQRLFDLETGLRFYASNGNACDISIEEILQYWGEDEKTRVIMLYAEILSNPGHFMKVASEVAARKPILAMSGGRTKEGAKAAVSHTGGLAGSALSTELLFEKAGIVTFRDQEEMCQAAIAFASQPIPRGNRVGLITDTGGPAIIGTDALVEQGLEIPPLSDRAKEILKARLFPEASVHNPIDVLATAAAPHYRAAMDVLTDEEQIDSIYINFVTPPFVDTESVAREMAEVSRNSRKPIVCNYMTDKAQWKGTTKILKDGGIPCYDFAEMAAKALASLTRYGGMRKKAGGTVRRFDDADTDKVMRIIREAKESGRSLLSSSEVFNILAAYGIPVADWSVTHSREEAVKAAAGMGFPVTVKADSASIVHKSDAGGVALDIRSGDGVAEAVDRMRRKFEADDLKFFIQKFLPRGRELIIGAKAESGLGHLIMFGVGGIFVEVLKDVVFKIAPVTDGEIGDMLTGIKAAPLIEGVRGEPGVHVESITETIARVSQLVTDVPMIAEMDLNPVVAYEDRISTVDARITIHTDA
jgi:acetyltransferase